MTHRIYFAATDGAAVAGQVSGWGKFTVFPEAIKVSIFPSGTKSQCLFIDKIYFHQKNSFERKNVKKQRRKNRRQGNTT